MKKKRFFFLSIKQEGFKFIVLISHCNSVPKTTEQSESKASLYYSHCFKFSSGRIWFLGAMSYARVGTEISAQAQHKLPRDKKP